MGAEQVNGLVRFGSRCHLPRLNTDPHREIRNVKARVDFVQIAPHVRDPIQGGPYREPWIVLTGHRAPNKARTPSPARSSYILTAGAKCAV